MIKITRTGPEKAITIQNKTGKVLHYSEKPKMTSNGELVNLHFEVSGIPQRLTAHFSEININDKVYASALEAIGAIADLCADFKKGGSPTQTGEMYIPSDDWDDVELPVVLRTGTNFVFAASNGLLYIGNSNTNSGIWCFDKKAKTFTQIWASGQNWRNFFETSKGIVYVSSTTATSVGVLRLPDTGNAVQVWAIGTNWTTFLETSKGIVYVGSSSTTTTVVGVLRLPDTGNAVQVWATGTNWTTFLETSKGIVYVGGSGSVNAGILRLPDTGNAVQVWATGANWTKIFETSKGIVYAGSTTATVVGILRLPDTGNAVQVWTVSAVWNIFLETSKGIVYVGSSAANTGILRLPDTGNAEQVYIWAGGLGGLFESSEGIVYTTAINEQQLNFEAHTGNLLTFQSGVPLKGYTLNRNGMFIEIKRDFPKKAYKITSNLISTNSINNTFLISTNHIIFNTK